MMKRTLFLPFLLFQLFSFAQTRSLTGKVITQKDATGLAKATISVKGGLTIAAYDDGSFSIPVSPGKITLVVRSIGYIQREITVGANENSVYISLQEEDKNLNEVVVV